jgi:hypothetical protein
MGRGARAAHSNSAHGRSRRLGAGLPAKVGVFSSAGAREGPFERVCNFELQAVPVRAPTQVRLTNGNELPREAPAFPPADFVRDRQLRVGSGSTAAVLVQPTFVCPAVAKSSDCLVAVSVSSRRVGDRSNRCKAGFMVPSSAPD